MRSLPLCLALAACVALLPDARPGGAQAHPDPLDSCYYVFVHVPSAFARDPGVTVCPNKP